MPIGKATSIPTRVKKGPPFLRQYKDKELLKGIRAVVKEEDSIHPLFGHVGEAAIHPSRKENDTKPKYMNFQNPRT